VSSVALTITDPGKYLRAFFVEYCRRMCFSGYFFNGTIQEYQAQPLTSYLHKKLSKKYGIIKVVDGMTSPSLPCNCFPPFMGLMAGSGPGQRKPIGC